MISINELLKPKREQLGGNLVNVKTRRAAMDHGGGGILVMENQDDTDAMKFDGVGWVQTIDDAKKWVDGADYWTIASLRLQAYDRFVEVDDNGCTLSPLRMHTDSRVTFEFIESADQDKWNQYVTDGLSEVAKQRGWRLSSDVWIEFAPVLDSFRADRMAAARGTAWIVPDGPDAQPIQYEQIGVE